jgi:hypothetical protein
MIDYKDSAEAARTNAADVVRDQLMKLADDLLFHSTRFTVPIKWPFIGPVKGTA